MVHDRFLADSATVVGMVPCSLREVLGVNATDWRRSSDATVLECRRA